MGVLSLVGGSQTFSSASGGKVTAVNNLSTAPVQVVAANPSRQKITFHNPGDVDIFVAPVILGNGTTLVPSTVALGGCFRVFANGGALVIDGECQGAWQAFTASSNGKPLTIMDSNLS
jgi:hypothetical protein